MSARTRIGRLVPAAFALAPESEPAYIDARERQDVAATLECSAGVLTHWAHNTALAGVGLRRGEPDMARQAFRELRRHRVMSGRACDAVHAALDWYFGGGRDNG